MADLPRVIDKIEDLPEPLRESLKEFYGPSTEPAFAGKLVLLGPNNDIQALQGTLTHERTQRASAIAELNTSKTRLTELEGELKKLREQPPSGSNAAAGTLAQQLKNLEDTSSQRIKALEDQVKEERRVRLETEGRIKRSDHLAELRKAAIDAGASDRTAEDLVNRMANMVQEKDGKYVPVKTDGTIILGQKSNPTEPMSFKELASSIIDDNPHLKKVSAGGNSGYGTQLPGGGNGQFTLTRAQARDPQVYRQKKAEAAKAGVELQIVEDQT